MTIVGEAVAPIIMGYCGYYGEYGDCLSHTAGMLWGDWRVCTFETLCLPLDKISCTRQFESKLSLHSFAKSLAKRRIFRKSPRPSLPLKRAPPLISVFSPSGKKRETALLGARNRYALRLAGHQSPAPWFCRMGPPGVRWGIGWVLPCSKAWWQRMVIELGLSSGYLMAGFLFPAKFIAERIFG